MARYPYLPCSSVLILLGSLVRGVRSTECRSSLGWEGRVTADRQQKKNGQDPMLLSPLSSISHVSMTARGMGSQLEMSTRASKYMYSPFPSDAIDSPTGTVDRTGHERQS